MNKIIVTTLIITFCTLSCKTQKEISKGALTEISKNQDRIYLSKTNNECNILKGVCPTLNIDQGPNEYSVIIIEKGIQYGIRRIENDENSISYSVITEEETLVMSNSKNEQLIKTSKNREILPNTLYNRLKLSQNITQNTEEELQKYFKHFQISKDTSYKYFILNNSKNIQSKLDNEEYKLFTWSDYRNIMISNYISENLIADSISIENKIDVLEKIEKSVKNSFDQNTEEYSCLIPSKLFKNLELQLGNSLTEHIKFNYIAETIFMDEKMKQFVKTKPEIYQDLVDKYITNLRK